MGMCRSSYYTPCIRFSWHRTSITTLFDNKLHCESVSHSLVCLFQFHHQNKTPRKSKWQRGWRHEPYNQQTNQPASQISEVTEQYHARVSRLVSIHYKYILIVSTAICFWYCSLRFAVHFTGLMERQNTIAYLCAIALLVHSIRIRCSLAFNNKN